MRWTNEYLSDEELQMLISDVEQNDMIAAPPDMAENILAGVEQIHREKKKEFRNYCFRVWTSVAAGLLMVFLLPKLMSVRQMQKNDLQPEWPDAPATQEIAMTEWKEAEYGVEANDRSIFETLLRGNHIFGNEDRYNLFNERNGR